MNTEALKLMALDLSHDAPRSPRATLGGFVIAARALDKFRADLLGMAGEYDYYPCGLFQMFLDFSGIDPDAFRDAVATGASDDEMDAWVKQHASVKDRTQIILWNNQMRDMRLSDVPDGLQVMMETYIPENCPQHRPVYVFFDIYDLEEGRL
jgi:hypothetical protein